MNLITATTANNHPNDNKTNTYYNKTPNNSSKNCYNTSIIAIITTYISFKKKKKNSKPKQHNKLPLPKRPPSRHSGHLQGPRGQDVDGGRQDEHHQLGGHRRHRLGGKRKDPRDFRLFFKSKKTPRVFFK